MTYFTQEELACKCCGVNKMDEGFMAKLETLRIMYDKPIIPTSAYRCPKHNSEVSTTGRDGPHVTGMAIDIPCSGKEAHAILGLSMYLGFKGIGIKQHGPHESRFIHLDMVESNLRPWVWSYA